MLAAFWLALRRPARGDVSRALDEIGDRLDRIDRNLGRASSRGDGLGPRIGETLDLGEVLSRTLAATRALGPVEGARVSVLKPDGTVETATDGLVTRTDSAIEEPPDGSEYTHGLIHWEVVGADSLRSGLVVPLSRGSLAVFSNVADAFDARSAALLATIAQRAEPAVRNALEHLRVLEEAATDARTGFGSASAFDQALPQAINSARRHRRPLCLIQIDMDDFGEINKVFSQDRGNAVLTEFGRRVLGTKRGADSIFRNSGGADEFFLILPETARDEAKNSYHRLCFEVSGTPFTEVGKVTMSSGLVELLSDDTLKTLLDRADALVREAKEHGKNRLCSDDGEEWVSPH